MLKTWRVSPNETEIGTRSARPLGALAPRHLDEEVEQDVLAAGGGRA